MDKRIIEDWKELRNKADALEDQITDRIQNILQLICMHFKAKYDTFWFHDAQEGELGSLSQALETDQITYHLEATNKSKLDHKSLWDYAESIPLEFLFMTNDEIIEYLNNESIILKEKEKEKKIKAEQRKKSKIVKEQEARKKLYEELKKEYEK